ncbi:hypothetical protein Ssi03_51020 [Sphaerisporangium siamense]|uniref:HNH endonuclease n=1 Tax=Sphaerisporangium siamense TaxID=795645 RepID=A0A7W7D8E4_9ACTN|nr:hypothetical protein [Sphaerisporangium siamense]MBB4702194.1 hypothetical protein [Sphaerisporangium siamense]GII87112.1 hypothetical protein Ssi03_51020 [Sphaerisporangium siamense]
MKRSAPLRRGKPLERYTPLQGGAPLARKTPLKYRSAKQEAAYRVRRPLVAALLAEHPVCERCRRARSVEVHEPRMRSRGVDICDPAECVALCHPCHRWTHDHPAKATTEGWLIPSHDTTTPARAAAERRASAAWREQAQEAS